ncbi:MAG: hypothetical protein ACFFCE_06370 [Promethearchaeota archaeon]
MALNYRLQEKAILTFETILNNGDIANKKVNIELDPNVPQQYSDSTPIILASFMNSTGQQEVIDEIYIYYYSSNNSVTISNLDELSDGELGENDMITLTIYANYYNKYQNYHSFTVNLATDQITLLNWTTTQHPEDTLMANYESSHFIYDTDPYTTVSRGKVQQIFAILNSSKDSTNSLIYYLTEDLNDPYDGWDSFDTLILKMGFLNPDVLRYLNVSFYYNEQNNYIGSTLVSLDMFEDDSGTLYITLPEPSQPNQWSNFKVANDASIMFTPIFNNATDFVGDFYKKGIPTVQTIEWDSELAKNGLLNVDLIRMLNESYSHNQYVIVLNELYEPIYPIYNVDTRTEELNIYDNQQTYEVEYNNISLPESYIDPNGNLMYMKDGDILYLKFNATLEQSIGLTIDQMVLQKAPYITDYLTNIDDVPIAEISLLGIHNDGNTYTIDDIYSERGKLVAWETALDLTPFENEFYDTYQQKVLNISFEDISSEFKTTDSNSIEYCYITDVLITSNDPRYQVVVDSFFIFEFDYNATLYDSEIFDIYPNNHIQSFYYGNYEDIYSELRTLDASVYLPLYAGDHSINETFYFDAFDSDGNYYYFDSHLIGKNTSLGIYDITWNPMYSGEYYNAYIEGKENLEELYDYYQPHIANYSYLYISWADENAWSEWHTIESPNINIDTLDITFEWYDEGSEDYESVVYNQTLGDFKARNIAVETIYPWFATVPTEVNFTLSQDYSNALDLDIMLIKGYFFNETSIDFDPDQVIIYPTAKTIEITPPNGYTFEHFEKILVYLNFSEGAYSDYTQFKMTDAATINHPEAPAWTKNDSLYVDFEYNDIDYFLLMEEYAVGSEESMFEHFEYMRNKGFVLYNPPSQPYSLTFGDQGQDFDNFTKIDDPKTILEFYDYDEDCTHEYVVQKDDITGDGTYDSFKYGYINPVGEISFHTLVQEVFSTEVNVNKNGEIRETEQYEVANNGVWATRTIITNTTTTTRVSKLSTLIQKDIDQDGYIDSELTSEQIFTSTYAIVCTTEITYLTFFKSDDVNHKYAVANFTEYRNSSYIITDDSISYTFRDFEYGEVVSTRYYDDVFPNELSEIYNLDNNLIPVVDTQGDSDPSNDIEIQAPLLENLLSLSHPDDNVPAIYDRKITVNSPVEVSNILATEKVITVPGSYNEGSGIADYTEEQQITVDAIEVIPEMGVAYDNTEGYNKDTIEDYKYLYYDDDGDGLYNVIFITDSEGYTVGIGLDYDGNAYFEPHKSMPVEKHIIKSEAATAEIPDSFATSLNIAEGRLINYKDYNNFDGLFVEPTFRDSLFDVWKMDYSGKSSKLMKLAMSITSHQFIEALTPQKIVGDITFQVSAMVASYTIGKVVGITLAGVLGAALEGTSIGTAGGGYIGAAIGFVVGMLTYWLINSLNAIEQQKKVNNYLVSQMTYNENYKTTETLSDKWWKDRYFHEHMTNALLGTTGGVYSEIKVETDEHIYQGQFLIASPGIDKTTNFGTKFNKIVLDYSQQTRSYEAYSDIEDPRLEPFLVVTEPIEEENEVTSEGILDGTINLKDMTITKPRNKNIKYMRNSLMYLEDQISSLTENEEKSYNRIIPYMMSVKPSLQVLDSETTAVPEFYLNYPIYVTHEKYEEQELYDEYNHIYKIYDETTETIQLIPDEYLANRPLMSNIVGVDVWLVDNIGTVEQKDGLNIDTEYNPFTGEVSLISGKDIYSTLNAIINDAKEDHPSPGQSSYDAYIVLDFHIEKYRDITVERDDITPEEAQRIATMQSTHQSMLQYLYQFTVAEQTQQRLSEICYTVFITVISTALSIGATMGIDKAFGSLGNSITTQGKALAAESSKTMTSQVLKNIGSKFEDLGGKHMGMYRIFGAMISESIEEVYVDPWIDSVVSNYVADCGYGVAAQILWSGLAESGREMTGDLNQLIWTGSGMNTHFQEQSQIQIKAEIEPNIRVQSQIETTNDLKIKAKEQQETKKGMIDYIDDFSPFIMLAGALTGGLLGSISAGFGNLLIGIGTSAETLDSLKDIYKSVLQKQQVKASNTYLTDRISDSLLEYVTINDIVQDDLSEAIEWAQLGQTQKPLIKDELFDSTVELLLATRYNPLAHLILGIKNFQFYPDHDYSVSENTGNVIGARGLNPNQIKRINNLAIRLINYLQANIREANKRKIGGSEFFYKWNGEQKFSYQRLSLELGMNAGWVGELRKGKRKFVEIDSIIKISTNILKRKTFQFLPEFVRVSAIEHFTDPMLDIWYNKRYSEEVDKPNRVELVDNIIEELQKLIGKCGVKKPLTDELISKILYSGHSEHPDKVLRSLKSHTYSKKRDEFDFTTLFEFIYYSNRLNFKQTRNIIIKETDVDLYIDKNNFKEFVTSINKLVIGHILRYGFTVKLQKQDVLIDDIDQDLLNLIISAMFAFADDNNREIVSIYKIAPTLMTDLRRGITPKKSVFINLKQKINSLTSSVSSKSKRNAIDWVNDFLKNIGDYKREDIGTLFHVPISEIFIRSLLDRNFKSFYEIRAKRYNLDFDKGTKVDTLIPRTTEFINFFEDENRLQDLQGRFYFHKDKKYFYTIPHFDKDIKRIVIDWTMNTRFDKIQEKLEKGYYTDDTHLLIVLYNEKRHYLAPKWDRDIKKLVDDFPDRINVITIEDLSNFLGLAGTGTNPDNPLPPEINILMKLKKESLKGDEDAFNALMDKKDDAIISLNEMGVNEYWFDQFLGSRSNI